LIWYLRNYQDGEYCTLPHVIELSKIPYEKLFTLLGAEPQIATLIDPFIQAFENKTMEMLDGQVAGAKIPLGRLSSPDLYYILSGNDFTLDINDPAAPKIFCLGGDPSRIEALAPVISLYIDRLTRICNRPEQYPCALVCDEFATVRAYNMATTVATGRSNNIIPILAIQDITQLRTQYSHQEADTLLNISGNLLCGQVSGETARWVSERFPRILQDRSSVSVNNSDTSISTAQQWEPTVTQSTISTLSSGEFLGITADEPGNKLALKTFHARIIQDKTSNATGELPVIQQVSTTTVMEQYTKIKIDIEQLVDVELAKIIKAAATYVEGS
jgi:type IV secretory pathway TraG/TraD family ATPase VirD4